MFEFVVLTVASGAMSSSILGLVTKPRKTTHGWRFAPFFGLHFLWGVLFAAGLWALFAISPTAAYYRVWERPVGFLLALAALATWPKSIEVTPDLIRKRNWRLAWRWIPWDDLIVSESRLDGAIVLRGVSDTIVFGPAHVGRHFFLRLLSDHTN